MSFARLQSLIGRRQAYLEFRWMKQESVRAGTSLDDMMHRRLEGEPLQYILGNQPFGPLSLIVRPPVLIPRPETEDWSLRLAELFATSPKRQVRMLDLGTGSGCIPLLLCRMLPAGTLSALGVDRSPESIELAKENASVCGYAPSPSSEPQNTFQTALDSFLDPHFPTFAHSVSAPFDLVTSNPPYISWKEYIELSPSVTRYEDSRALFGGPDGLDFYRAITLLVSRKGFLNAGATVALEVGHEQAEDVQEMLRGVVRGKSEIWLDPWNKKRTVVMREILP